MKILLINKFHYLRGGSERVYFETKELLESKGHEVICFSMKHEKNLPCAQENFFVDNIDFESKKFKWYQFYRYLYYPKAGQQLEKLILQEKPDIAHIHNYAHQLTPAIFKPLRKYNIPVVQTLHDYQLISANYNLYNNGKIDESGLARKYYQYFFRKSIRKSYLASLLAMIEMYLQWIFKFYRNVYFFISPSNFLKNKIKDWKYKLPIKVIPNFIDASKHEPSFTSQDYILYFGRLSHEKGVMTLIKAVRKVPTIKLIIAGSGPEQNRIKDYLKVKQAKNIQLVGYKQDVELAELIKNCRFVVVPSEWYENYPMSVLESMAYGKPVLVADIGGLSEMVEPDKTGWFFMPGKIKNLRFKIKQNYDQLETLEKMGRLARQTVEQKNCSEVYYKELLSIYEKVLGSDDGVSLG